MAKDITILIVDDKLSARETLKGLLMGQNYKLVLMGSGIEALDKVAEVKPDLILLDVMMPEMDGFEVCHRLKTNEQWQHIPVILVTALDSKEDLVRGLEAGADDFLAKPVNSLELRARVRSMLRIKKQFDQLQANVQLREDMAAMIVHDMRSPLMSIWWINEIVRDKLSRLEAISHNSVTELVDLNERISHQVNRLNAFANDILTLAKMRAGQESLNYQATDIKALVLEAHKNHQEVAEQTQIKLEANVPSGQGLKVRLDEKLWQRVLDNLISNALKYSPPNGQVIIELEYLETETTTAEDAKLRLKVKDEGPGIPETYRKSIFDKYKVVNLKKKVPQVGLGLAFCKQVVESHGGRIWVEANNPNGSVFILEI